MRVITMMIMKIKKVTRSIRRVCVLPEAVPGRAKLDAVAGRALLDAVPGRELPDGDAAAEAVTGRSVAIQLFINQRAIA